jgi:hypothetical protein
MKRLRLFTLFVIVIASCGRASAQDLDEISRLWQQTFDALQHHDSSQAKTVFSEFNRRARSYVQKHGRTWQIEYLIGSLSCQFSESRASGANFLRDILQNNRALSRGEEQELKRQLTVCTGPLPAMAALPDANPDLYREIADTSVHLQTPRVHGDMKGGYRFIVANESAVSISPVPAEELQARRVPLSDPQRALASALRRLPSGASGGIIQEFAVTTSGLGESRAMAIGRCLQAYTQPLKDEFEIQPSTFMITVYAADSPGQVYNYARLLHGLQLPDGVVAYSLTDDMSLAGVAEPSACGSLAHELVHLLIKRNFLASPAWLEEGLASEVAVATPEANHFKFSWSWRDDTLRENSGIRPRVAELLEAPWSVYSANGYIEMSQAAAVQAMAAAFIRYLDSRGALSDVYFAVRDQHFSPDLTQYKSYGDIVEAKLGKNLVDIDSDFAQWFQKQEEAHPRRPAPHRVDDAGRPAICTDANASPMAQQAPCKPEVMNKERQSPAPKQN